MIYNVNSFPSSKGLSSRTFSISLELSITQTFHNPHFLYLEFSMYHIMSHTSSSDIEIESTVLQSNILTMLNDMNILLNDDNDEQSPKNVPQKTRKQKKKQSQQKVKKRTSELSLTLSLFSYVYIRKCFMSRPYKSHTLGLYSVFKIKEQKILENVLAIYCQNQVKSQVTIKSLISWLLYEICLLFAIITSSLISACLSIEL